MTHNYTYTVAGITCEGCVAKVKHQLLTHPDVLKAEVTLEGQRATVTMQRHIPVHELQKAIGIDTKYTIGETPSTHPTAASAPSVDSPSWLATYKPLLLIAGFITGVSFITANGSLHTGMNTFMAGFFLVFSFFKFLDLRGFANSYAMYDLLAMKVPAYGFVYPFVELALGLAYLTGFNPLVTNWTALLVMGFSSLGVIQSVVNKKQIRCACLGAVFNLPMSTVTIIEDLLMVTMAAYMIAFH
jgi:cation transport ATPase